MVPEDLGFPPVGEVVDRLARARIGATYNQYARSELRRERLRTHLEERADANIVLVGEAAGYRGARVSGVPFTSERQLTGAGRPRRPPRSCTASCASSALENDVLLWNVVPTHPGTASIEPPADARRGRAPRGRSSTSSRAAAASSRSAGSRQRVLDAPYVRHPSHGGALAFAEGLRRTLGDCDGRRSAGNAFLLAAGLVCNSAACSSSPPRSAR